MNMQEATIAKWHKQVGDSFAKDEALYLRSRPRR